MTEINLIMNSGKFCIRCMHQNLINQLLELLLPYFYINKTIDSFDFIFELKLEEGKNTVKNGSQIWILPHKNIMKSILANAKYDDLKREYYIEKYKTYIVIDIEKKYITISSSEEGNLLSMALFAIRDAAYLLLVKEGYIQIHASAVVTKNNNEITIFCGDSNGGKTTLLFDYLNRGQYDFVSNGRVFAKIIANDIQILGTPENIGIRKKTLNKYKQLNETISFDDEVKMPYRKVKEVFKCKIIPNGVLKKIIIACFNRNISISNQELIKLFERQLIKYKQIKRREWIGLADINENEYDQALKNVKENICENFCEVEAVFLCNGKYEYRKVEI